MIAPGDARARLREGLYRALERSPRLYCAYNRHKDPYRAVVRPDSDICVEGYAAAANSHVREVLLAAHPELRIASHMHRVAHVRAALQLGVPVVILLREPRASVRSVLLRFPEHFDLHRELAHNERFYRQIRPLAGRVGLVRFEDATTRIGAALAANAAALGLDLPTVDDDDQEVAERARAQMARYTAQVFGPDEVEFRQARPSAVREQQGAAVDAALSRPEATARLQRTAAIHDELAAIAADRLERWQTTTEVPST